MDSMHGIGLDIVAIEKLKSMLERHPQACETIFTELEHNYCRTARNWAERYAARFAAKEAVLKALGTGMAKGMSWQDIEIYNLPTGKPCLRLSGEVGRKAALLGLSDWLVSLTHSREFAVACVAAHPRPLPEEVRNPVEVLAGIEAPDEAWFM